jgi:hypothetical protein
MDRYGTVVMGLCPGRWRMRAWEPKGNAIIITKQASGSAKIDPLMAAFNACADGDRSRASAR